MDVSNFADRMPRIVSRSEVKLRVSTVHTREGIPLLSTRNFHRAWVSQTISLFGKLSRRAATAGNVCTISPREPRRTTRKRGSAMRSLADGIQQAARRMILWIAYNGDA